jgi:hypothetical protein
MWRTHARKRLDQRRESILAARRNHRLPWCILAPRPDPPVAGRVGKRGVKWRLNSVNASFLSLFFEGKQFGCGQKAGEIVAWLC